MSRLRAWFAIVLAALPLLGAADLGLAPPVVVVYPLTATGDVGSATTGSSVAAAIADRLVQLGGITIKPYIAGTTRQQYLTAAISQSADYYITGYITPLGSEVSVVEQVVSTRSGSIVYSTTAFARTYADAVGPTESLRDAILHHAGRGMASLDAPPPSPSPEPLADKGGVNISKALGRRHKAAPAPSPSASAAALPASTPAGTAVAPVASATRPSPPSQIALGGNGSTVLVISTVGTADAAARDYASRSLVSALRRNGVGGAFLPVSSADVDAHAADLCAANGASSFYAPTLAIDGTKRGAGVMLEVAGYDCKAGATFKEAASTSAKAATRASVEKAIDAATSTLAKRLGRPGGATRAIPPAAT